MISTSYDLDDSNQRNSSNSMNDEESIFLSSSSDEDLPLSSRFASVNKQNKNKYMETMINDGLEEDEEDEDEHSLVSEDESDEEVQYIPATSTYSDDLIDVSDEENESKPTKMYDEYDPENIDEFNDAALKNQNPKTVIEYEPTKLKKKPEPADEANKPKTRQTRSSRAAQVVEEQSVQESVRSKRKYNRRSPVVDEDSQASNKSQPVTKRPYNNTNRAKNAESKKQLVEKEKKKPKLVNADASEEMVMSPRSAGSPVSTVSLSDDGTENNDKEEPTKKLIVNGIKKKKTTNEITKSIGEASKFTTADDKSTVISGRIINLSSGFKIPKRSSSETDQASVPPEKKVKTSEDSKKIVKSTSKSSEQTTKDNKQFAKPSSVSATKPVKPIPSKSSSTDPSKKPSKPQKPVVKERVVKESDLFMEALGTSRPTVRSKPKVSKTSSSKTESRVSSEIASKSTTSSQQAQNLDKLNTNNITSTARDSTTSNSDSNNSDKDSNNINSAPGKETGSNLSEPSITKKNNKRRVVWADACQKQLESVSYFYLDETEREIKKNAFKGGDMAKIEKLNEKELKFKHHDDFSFDNVHQSEAFEWPALIPIDLPDYIVQPQICSAEHEIQLKREKDILEVLMFKQFLPDSPSEPTDLTPVTITTKLIPLEDVNLSTSDFETSINEPPQSQNDMYSNHHNQKNNVNNQNHMPSRTSNSNQNNNKDYTNNNGKSMDYYNKSYYSQHPQDKDARIHVSKPLSPTSTRPAIPNLFAPVSPTRSPPQQKSNNVPNLLNLPTKLTISQADTPLSPPVTASNTNPSRLYKPVESPLASEPKTEEQPAASLNNLANSLLSSDEMTEKIKQILCQINMTKPLEAVKEPEPVNKLTSITDSDFNPPKPQKYNNYNNNGNNEYKKNSKWNTNYQGNNNNNNKFHNNYKNNDSRGSHHNNNRNTFQNNFRRGIGNRGGADNHSNFNNRNFNNDGYGSKYNNNRGGGSHGSYNNGHRNNSRFDHNKRESRFDSGASTGANGKNVYENDKPKETPAPAATNVGRWI